MSITKIASGYLEIVRVRSNGKIVERRAKSKTKEGLKAEVERLKAEIRGNSECSLTNYANISTFGGILDFYTERKGFASMETIFKKLKNDLGHISIPELADKFDRYLQILKKQPSRTGKLRAGSTINRYLSCAKIACQFSCKRSFKNITGMTENPLFDFEFEPEEGRDRVLSEDEKLRIFSSMEKLNSYLYWPYYFSLKNPIRRDDLRNLQRENLDMFKPWVHHYPSKTRKRKPREAVLPFLDEAIMQYFKNLPSDCEYLFPHINKNGSWKKLGDFRTHWHTILRHANVKDLHWHDLKHCAITWMLDSGYSERDIKNLGVQYDSRMIDLYYNLDASKVLKKWQAGAKCEGTVKELIRGIV